MTITTLENTVLFFFSSSLLEEGREKRKTGDEDEWGYHQKPERALKRKIHNISAACEFFVKAAELNSISQSLGEKIKIFVKEKL